MNASSAEIVEEINGGSESDTSSDGAPDYYQPISVVDHENDDSDTDADQVNSDFPGCNSLSNGYCVAENAMSAMRLDSVVDEKMNGSDDEQEDRTIEESESAITRAFREDESRRNAPLTAENATRVMEAMRGVSLGGSAPDWVNQFPNDRWIDQLRRMRQQSRSSTSVQNLREF